MINMQTITIKPIDLDTAPISMTLDKTSGVMSLTITATWR
jgi:hypothetical protein